MLSAALLYAGIVGLLVLLGYGSVGISYLMVKDSFTKPNSGLRSNNYYPLRRGY